MFLKSQVRATFGGKQIDIAHNAAVRGNRSGSLVTNGSDDGSDFRKQPFLM
jgi:hypothetical protein